MKIQKNVFLQDENNKLSVGQNKQKKLRENVSWLMAKFDTGTFSIQLFRMRYANWIMNKFILINFIHSFSGDDIQIL